jgi:GTPase
MSNNIVAIVGRPNVGKSTLYNRLVGKRQAIVDNLSGVTRDRQYAPSNWIGKEFIVVDTGGFVHGSDDVFEAAIRRQVHLAVDEAAVIIFMVDCHDGITPLDEEVARLLRQAKKPVILAVNKVDNPEMQLHSVEFWSLGFDHLFTMASSSGSGTGELLDQVVSYLPNDPLPIINLPRLAVVGQPNAGKSTLVNALLGEERNIVTEIAGTTRDSIHTQYNKFGHEFILVDTAGIRKKAKVHEDLEFYSVMRAIKALEEADIVLLVIDATMGIEAQDLNIFRLAKERNKGIVIIVNKWDLVEKDTNTHTAFSETIKNRINPFDDVPILYISATEKQRIFKVVEEAMHVYENRTRRISTSELNRVMLEAIAKFPAPPHRSRFISIKFVSQLPTYFPAFAFFCNHPKHIKDSYKHYLENQLRKSFDFEGVPIGVYFRDK